MMIANNIRPSIYLSLNLPNWKVNVANELLVTGVLYNSTQTSKRRTRECFEILIWSTIVDTRGGVSSSRLSAFLCLSVTDGLVYLFGTTHMTYNLQSSRAYVYWNLRKWRKIQWFPYFVCKQSWKTTLHTIFVIYIVLDEQPGLLSHLFTTVLQSILNLVH